MAYFENAKAHAYMGLKRNLHYFTPTEEACGMEGQMSSSSIFSPWTISLSCTDVGLTSGSSCCESCMLQEYNDNGINSFLYNEAVWLMPAGLEGPPWISLICDTSVSVKFWQWSWFCDWAESMICFHFWSCGEIGSQRRHWRRWHRTKMMMLEC